MAKNLPLFGQKISHVKNSGDAVNLTSTRKMATKHPKANSQRETIDRGIHPLQWVLNHYLVVEELQIIGHAMGA
eukprot:g60726.t1